jgi:membrane-associated phospholipid phosphatase
MIKNKRFVYLILILSFVCNLSFAQNNKTVKDTTSSKKSVGSIIVDDFVVSFNDGIKTFASPFHYNTKDAIIAGAVLTTTALLFTIDDESRSYFKKQSSSFNDNLKDVGNFYGTIYPTIITSGGLYAVGIFLENDNIRVTGRMVFESVAIAGLLNVVTKSVLGRHRPYTNDGSTKFEGPTLNADYLSLPSGHAVVAFAFSTTLANRIHNTYASIGLYSLAGITALARIYDDKHWASDVFLGSAIGYFVGDFISGKKNKETAYHIYPTLNGLKLVYSL